MAEPQHPQFIVRLVMRVEAINIRDAVPAFLDTLIDKGMRHWVYRVEDPETNEVLGYFDGHGTPVELEALLEVGTTEDAESADEDDASDADEAAPEGESDEELLAVAEQATKGE